MGQASARLRRAAVSSGSMAHLSAMMDSVAVVMVVMVVKTSRSGRNGKSVG